MYGFTHTQCCTTDICKYKIFMLTATIICNNSIHESCSGIINSTNYDIHIRYRNCILTNDFYYERLNRKTCESIKHIRYLLLWIL